MRILDRINHWLDQSPGAVLQYVSKPYFSMALGAGLLSGGLGLGALAAFGIWMIGFALITVLERPVTLIHHPVQSHPSEKSGLIV